MLVWWCDWSLISCKFWLLVSPSKFLVRAWNSPECSLLKLSKFEVCEVWLLEDSWLALPFSKYCWLERRLSERPMLEKSEDVRPKELCCSLACCLLELSKFEDSEDAVLEDFWIALSSVKYCLFIWWSLEDDWLPSNLLPNWLAWSEARIYTYQS